MMDGQATSDYSRLFARGAAALIAAVALLVIGGWMFNIPQLTAIIPGYATMKPVTALCFILCGASLWRQARSSGDPATETGMNRIITVIPASLAWLIALISISQYLFVRDFGIDLLLFSDEARAEGAPYPGRMSLATGLCFLLIAGALVMGGWNTRWSRYVPDILALPAIFISLLAISGYVFGAPSLYRIGPFSSMALGTALLAVLLGVSALAARPEQGIASDVNAQHSGRLAVKLLLPVAIIATITVGWLTWRGEVAGWYDAQFGLAIYTTALIAMITGLILFTAYRLNIFSASRMRAFELLEIQRHALERVALSAKLADTLEGILWDVEQLEPEMLTSILFLSEDGRRIKHGAALRLPHAYMAAIDDLPIGPAVGSCGTAAWRRKQVVVTKIATDPLWADYREIAARYDLQACWSTPIIGASGKVIGTFAIYYQKPKQPGERQQRLISTVTQVVAVAIDRAREMDNLVQAKADLESAQERGNIGSWELVLGASRARWSRQMYRIFRRDPQMAVPTLAELLELIHQDDREMIANTFTRTESLHKLQHLEFRLQPSIYGTRYISATVDLVRDEDGKAVAMAGTMLDITERKSAEVTIQRSLSHQQELARRLAEVEEDERRKISRELHDRIGSELSAINLNLDIIRSVLPGNIPEAISTRLTDTQSLVRDTIEHTQDILAELRPPGLDDYGLIVALENYAGLIEQRLGIPVLVGGCRNEPPLSVPVKSTFYRIVTEALNNIAKHARASMVKIDLTLNADTFSLAVVDDGVGFNPSDAFIRRYGLRTMQERAEAVDANVTIESAPSSGTRVTVDVECLP